jgi:hypothetical protein
MNRLRKPRSRFARRLNIGGSSGDCREPRLRGASVGVLYALETGLFGGRIATAPCPVNEASRLH